MKILLDMFYTSVVLLIGICLMVALPVFLGLLICFGVAYFIFIAFHSARLDRERQERLEKRTVKDLDIRL